MKRKEKSFLNIMKSLRDTEVCTLFNELRKFPPDIKLIREDDKSNTQNMELKLSG